ncbi:MAG TPA: HYR domain-containing protein [Pyrinomonadaceae bacterium]
MKRKRLFLSLMFLTACALALLAPGVRAWMTTVSPGSRASAVVVDAAGDVIAAGYSPPSVVKMSGATGEVIWRCEVALSETPSDLALDANGDVFVVGFSRGVTKVSGTDGSVIWRRGVGGTAQAFGAFLSAVTVDRNGDVLIAGQVSGIFNVSKLDGQTGDVEWFYEREGFAYAVAVDPSGDVAAAGFSNKNFAVVKLRGSDGLELWERELNGAGNWTDVFEEARAVVMDADGSVIAVGNTANIFANVSDFTIVKYAPDGTLKWSHALDGGWCVLNHRNEIVCQSTDGANAVTLGPDGSVYAAGFMETELDGDTPGAGSHMYVARFSKDGVQLWGEAAEDLPSRGEYTRGFVMSLAVDAVGNAYAAGQHDFRFAAVKFNGAGQRIWLRQAGELPGAGNHCTAVKVVADAATNVVVAGETLMPNQFTIYTVIKLRGADGADYTGEPRPEVPETVTKYAPLVYLHPDDEFRPADPAQFIRRSELRWSHQAVVACGDHAVAERGTVMAARLGQEPAYTHNPRNTSDLLCRHREDVELSAHAYTRPFDGSKRDNVLGREDGYLKEGFFLDPENDPALRRGIQAMLGGASYTGAPVFYEYEKGRYVTYWFFYAYNEYRPPLPNLDGPLQSHEGDWERVSIQLDAEDNPLNVFYYHHADGMLAQWDTIAKHDGTHPVVYSAKGSHGSYPDAGFYPTELPGAMDDAARGPAWITWEDLSDVKAQPWYGFGGAWGEVSGLVIITTPFGDLSGGDFTGPLGPSPYKNSLTKWAPGINGRVSTSNGKGLASVLLTLADGPSVIATTTTDSKGEYNFPGLVFGQSYTVMAAKEGHVFDPVVRTFTFLAENQTADFAARDIVPPMLTVPADITADAVVADGTTVYFTATATDNVTAEPRVICEPPSGSLFGVGITNVNCTATDDDGNTASGTFRVTIRGATEQMTELLSVIRQFNLRKADEQKLTRNLEQAREALSQGQPRKACRDLEQFATKVRQETGKSLTAQRAAQLLDAAARISAVAGCR